MSDQARYIEHDAALAEALEHWRASGTVGLDTEFMRTRTFFPIPALYQVSTPDAVYLVDPLPIGSWDAFAAFLADSTTTKVVHACSEDLEVFARHLEVRPEGLFDTQVAVGFLGPDFSLSYAGRAEDAIEAAHKAMRLNPHYPDWYVAQSVLIYHDARRYEDGLTAVARLRSFDTAFLRLYQAACAAALGRDGEARAAIERVLAFDPVASLEKWTNPKMAPYKRPEDLEHFRENLRKAGLPD